MGEKKNASGIAFSVFCQERHHSEDGAELVLLWKAIADLGP